MYKTLENLEDLIKREIGMVNEKGDLTPNELCNMKEAVELLNEIEEYKTKSYEDNDDAMRSGRGYGHMHSYDSYEMEGSHRRGRDSMGRFTSRDSHAREERSMDRMRSGHSIKDRMKATLEEMVDKAKSEYEREEILETIDRLDLISR